MSSHEFESGVPAILARPMTGAHPDKPTILVVDDTPAVRKLILTVLERNGFIVRLAASGAEAVHTFQTEGEQIAVVLLDVRMPGLDGPHTLAAMRRSRPDVRCCFMSGDADPSSLAEVAPDGPVTFLPKPFRLDDLMETVHRLAADALDHRLTVAT